MSVVAKNPVRVAVPDVETMGPAMRALTESQRAFVIAFFETGKREEAASLAGYSGELRSNTLGVTAHRLFHSPKVTAAINEYARDHVLPALVPQALRAVRTGMERGSTAEQLKAAGMALDRAGFAGTSIVQHQEVQQSFAEKVREIRAAAEELGIDVATLLGGAGKFFDGEAAEVTDVTDVTEVTAGGKGGE